jgi:hypothetical protein
MASPLYRFCRRVSGRISANATVGPKKSQKSKSAAEVMFRKRQWLSRQAAIDHDPQAVVPY